jgi:hypothetical protein
VATNALGGASCTDLSPGDPAIDLRVDESCPQVVSGAPLSVDTTGVTDGAHRLVVRATDAGGNSTTISDQAVEVINTAPQPSATATLGVGTGAISGAGGASGGGASALEPCPSPRLSMRLSQRPLRRSRGVAVLRARRRYRFAGRLTCLVAGRRVSAPQGLGVELLNVVRGRTLRKTGMTVRRRGRLTIILAYRSSRAIIFRYRATDGRTARVRIRIRVSRLR